MEWLLERPREHCGVIAIVDAEEASRLTYFGLYSLQHRGQESAGIASTDGKLLKVHKRAGLVSTVFLESEIATLKGSRAVGHVRYSTSKGSHPQHAQPVSRDENLVLSHNGNFATMQRMEKFSEEKGIDTGNCNDTEMMYEILRFQIRRGATLAEAVVESYPLFDGVFAAIAMTKDEVVAFQDPCAIKPLCFGRINGGFAFASESCALNTVGAEFVREVGPGEMIIMDKNGFWEEKIVMGDFKRDSWEFVYFARPDSIMLGRSIYEVRKNFGRILAEEHPTQADFVIPIPKSGIPAAISYSQVAKIPYEELLVKNDYIGRTFIEPSQRVRDLGVQLKLNPIEELLRGKSVVVVDDSIVRGTTSPKIVDLLRKVGVKEVHMRIASSPYRFPDYYGTDTPIQDGLIAARKTIEEIRQSIGADSLGYLSYSGLLQGIGLPEEMLSNSWHNGVYPIPIYERASEIFTPAT